MWGNWVMQRDEMARLRTEILRASQRLERAKASRNALIIEAFNTGMPREDIARAAGLSVSTVYAIIRRSH